MTIPRIEQLEGMLTSHGYAYNHVLIDTRSKDNEWYLWHIAYVDYFKSDGSYAEDIVFIEMWSNRFLDMHGSRLEKIVRRDA